MKLDEYVKTVADNVPHPLELYGTSYGDKPTYILKNGIIYCNIFSADPMLVQVTIRAKHGDFSLMLAQHSRVPVYEAAKEHAEFLTEILNNKWKFLLRDVGGREYFRWCLAQTKTSHELCELIVIGLREKPIIKTALIDPEIMEHARKLNAMDDLHRVVKNWFAGQQML